MGHGKKPRRQHDAVRARYEQRISALERKVAARRAGTGHPNVAHLRARIHEVIYEMERLLRPKKGRAALLARAHAMLRELPAPKRGQGQHGRHSHSALAANAAAAAIGAKLKTVESEVRALVTERSRCLRSDLPVTPALRQREEELNAHLRSLLADTRATVSDKQQQSAIVARVERIRARLRAAPKPKAARPATAHPDPERERRARLRKTLEREERERREKTTSVRTVGGGLPGLGRRR